MAMTPKAWSVNAIAVELARDRRTVAARLHRIEPAGTGPHGPLYHMADVVRVLHGGTSLERNEAAWTDGADKGALYQAEDLAEFLDRKGPRGYARRLARASKPRECSRIVLEMVLASTIRLGANPFGDDEGPLRVCAKASDDAIESAFAEYLNGGATIDEIVAIVEGRDFEGVDQESGE